MGIYQELGLRAGLVRSLGNLSHAQAELGEIPQALQMLEQALSIAHELGDDDAQARLLGGRGELYHQQGELDHACQDYEAALALIETQRLDLVFPFHRESFFGRERQWVYARLARLLTEQGAKARAWQVCEQSRSRTFLDQLAQSRWPRPAGVDDTWWEEVSATLDQIRALTHKENQPNDRLPELAPQRRALLADARKRLNAALQAPSAGDWRDLLSGTPISYQELPELLSSH